MTTITAHNITMTLLETLPGGLGLYQDTTGVYRLFDGQWFRGYAHCEPRGQFTWRAVAWERRATDAPPSPRLARNYRTELGAKRGLKLLAAKAS